MLIPMRRLTFHTRYFSAVKRKYPIDPEEAKKLPVFDYGSSSPDYRRVFVWGNVQTGALGVPYFKSKENPEMRDMFRAPRRLGFAEQCKVKCAAAGFGFSIYGVQSDTNVKVYGSGLNTDSQIGYHAVKSGHPLAVLFFPKEIPLPFANPEKTEVRKVAAGRAHSAVLSDQEGLFLLGNNAYGQCARRIIEDEDYQHSNYINHVASLDGRNIVDVECGQDHTLAITEDGRVYSCGWGADGQTGLGNYKNCDEFTQVKGDIEHERIVQVASRSDFVLALSESGDVFGWGNAEYDQIPSQDQQVCNATHVKLGNVGKVINVGAGGSFCAVVNSQNQVFTWGYGILGAGPRVDQSAKPVKLPETLFGCNDFQLNSKVLKVRCGLSYALAVTNLGDVYAWGRNTKACLGLGHEKDQYFPFKVAMGGSAVDVSCGVDHTIAVCKPFI